MRINEIEDLDNSLTYDLVDDIIVYMRNDPMFYRKSFFPTMIHMKKLYKTKKDLDPSLLLPLINKAKTEYCKKFNILKKPDDLLDKVELDDLVKRLYTEELENIKNGNY